MENLICYRQWICKISGWYQFRARYRYFEGASRFVTSRMCITCSLQILEQLSRGKTFLKYHIYDKRKVMS